MACFPASCLSIIAVSHLKNNSYLFNPSWLLRDPKMKLRTTYRGFTKAVNHYFDKIIPKIVQLQVNPNAPFLWPRELIASVDFLDKASLLSITQKQEVYIAVHSNSWNAQLEAFSLAVDLKLNSVYFCFLFSIVSLPSVTVNGKLMVVLKMS